MVFVNEGQDVNVTERWWRVLWLMVDESESEPTIFRRGVHLPVNVHDLLL